MAVYPLTEVYSLTVTPTIVKLAAGVGRRLRPLTDSAPKILLDIGNGQSLLGCQLEALAGCGLRRVRLVLGYRAEQVEAALESYRGFDFEVVYNPFYRVSDNLVSAWMGLRGLSGHAILINGDNLYTPAILERLVRSGDAISMAVRKKASYDADDMKVFVRDGLVVDVGKELDAAAAAGESMGMISFRGGGLASMWATLDRMVRSEECLNSFYLSALRRLMHASTPVRANAYEGCGWAEIDDADDLESVRRLRVSG